MDSKLASPVVRWAVERRLMTHGGPDQMVRIGTVAWVGNGYRFTPNVSGRKPSRKVHPTLDACLPRWVGYPNRCETRGLR